MLMRLVIMIGALFLLLASVAAVIDRLLSDRPISRAIKAAKE
jgi:hypothetical protein